MTVWVLIEKEPDDSEFPAVVLGVYASKTGAETEADRRRAKAEYDGRDEDEIWWHVEPHEVRE